MTEWGTGHEPDPDELVDFLHSEVRAGASAGGHAAPGSAS